MKTHHIRNPEWSTFCGHFTKLNHGTVVTVEHTSEDGRKADVGRDISFQEMKLEQRDGCSDQVRIVLGEKDARAIVHEVIEPIHFMVREMDGGGKVLQIDGESGTPGGQVMVFNKES